MSRQYTISELSKEFGIPVSTLRFYNRSGLFKPVYRDEKSGYYYYSSDQIINLDLLTLLRELDMPIHDIRDIIENAKREADVIARLKEHRANLSRQIIELQYRADKILKIESAYDSYASIRPPEPGKVVVREFGARMFVHSARERFSPKEGGEWNLLIRKKIGFPGLEKDYPIALAGMGATSSLAEYNTSGKIFYSGVFLEPFEDYKNESFPARNYPPGKYLVLRFDNKELHRQDAYIILSEYIQKNGLKTDDIIFDIVIDCVIPPIETQRNNFELQIMLH